MKKENVLNKKITKGFTLIELLVVVLIIGILAAIALPQYYRMVRKTRVSQAILTLKALITAEESYYLVNNAMASDFSTLDVEVQNSDDYSYLCNQSPFGGSCGASPQKSALPVLEFFPSYNANYPNKRWCQAYDTNMSAADKAKALEICKMFGPQDPRITHAPYYLVE